MMVDHESSLMENGLVRATIALLLTNIKTSFPTGRQV